MGPYSTCGIWGMVSGVSGIMCDQKHGNMHAVTKMVAVSNDKEYRMEGMTAKVV